MLATENINVDILCFMEHWLPEVQMNVLNIDDFKLASNFSRKHSKAGGSCIFIRNNIQTEQMEYLGTGERKGF